MRASDNLIAKINEAKFQADIYSAGSIAALELTNYRYLIMVSEKHIDFSERQMFTENEITYRVINIVYSPDKPSERSRKAGKKLVKKPQEKRKEVGIHNPKKRVKAKPAII